MKYGLNRRENGNGDWISLTRWSAREVLGTGVAVV